jgi:putative transposase
MTRQSSASVATRNAAILERIRALKAEHPFWGYRRVWATLRFTDKLAVNPKRILRLMRVHQLLVTPETNNKVSRTPTRSKPRPTQPNQWWGIDMTKVITETGWAYVVVVLDWYTKKIVGHYAGEQAKSGHWLLALDQAVNRQFPGGVREHDLHLMSDNGSQPTSLAFMRVCGQLGIRQAFTSYNNPKGNADTERMMRTLKEELFWLREWSSPTQVAEALDHWVTQYNATYRHSALGYRTPIEFEQEVGLNIQLRAA